MHCVSRSIHFAFAAILLHATVPSPAASQEAKSQDVRQYTCAFQRGVSQVYAKGTYRTRKAQPIAFDISAIDLDGQRAELVTGGGTGPLRIVRAVDATHFLEVVTEGFLNVTTIYKKDTSRGVHPAAHSRHFGLFGEPVIAQYTGACTSK